MGQFTIRAATAADRDEIFRLRHDVYAVELQQYPVDPSGRLAEPADSGNVHLLALAGGELAGFVSLTPPSAPRYFVERYLDEPAVRRVRAGQPYEIRALTVHERFRRTPVASLLIYAALRWVVSRGGRTAIAMGRAETQDMYARLGLHRTGVEFTAGAQRYGLMRGDVAAARVTFAERYRRVLPRLAALVRWELDTPFHPEPEPEPGAPAEHCAHGGRSFDAIGTRFDRLDRRHRIVTADVLDAWFPPAPGVLAALTEDPAWLARTSPPAQADGLITEIAEARGVDPGAIVVGAGSSDLIYRTLPRLAGAGSRVLLMQPTYGEYPHLIAKLGARADVLRLRPENGWRLDPDELRQALRRDYDLVVLVNPGNPTGRHVDAELLWSVLRDAPPSTTIWVDETYTDYAGPGQSLESRAALVPNLIVCKSMSKAYALSGLRVGYLVASEPLAAGLRRWSPPWPVALPAQVAAIRALRDPGHYQDCWQRTGDLRRMLADGLRSAADVEVLESEANFVLVRLPREGMAAEVRRRCEADGVFVRDVSPLSPDFRDRYVRVAVKDVDETERIVAAFGRLSGS
ncbi:aminotransferase class I/II-fold pyridoxal phosphate-dependent enzyme [Actinoplanes oblitus]|uniref:Aminotransferase n=1 Tax=Actinoplanes oblitus TaxID=3040509 RepID=A0ABY8WSA4_9ACTN|nr:aminotransferase class I/II-fold pyridoxal phosphate-dependent enzyme [Actinoplanes oblitus]WIN00358.1 aminotransferase class I/II-fold pyridoxal phosphate-dependent enzyme [Actinoplanes oblitus]